MNKTSNNTPNRTEIKELIKTGKAFSFVGQKISKAFETEEGDYYIEAVASSDQEDLVGDIMSSKALKVMERDFVGKTVFMNHRTNVPDDVFGSIVEASIKNVNGAQLLIFKIIVERENKAALKTWKVIKGGRTQLGTSVTVLVKAAKPNPARKGGIIIDDVETIEHSIVGVPCNRESKTMAASASKALNISGPTSFHRNQVSGPTDFRPSLSELEKAFDEKATETVILAALPTLSRLVDKMLTAEAMAEAEEERRLRAVLQRGIEVTSAMLKQPLHQRRPKK